MLTYPPTNLYRNGDTLSYLDDQLIIDRFPAWLRPDRRDGATPLPGQPIFQPSPKDHRIPFPGHNPL